MDSRVEVRTLESQIVKPGRHTPGDFFSLLAEVHSTSLFWIVQTPA
jgi:hypothetical protein